MNIYHRITFIILVLFAFSCKKNGPLKPINDIDSTKIILSDENYLVRMGGKFSFAGDMATDQSANIYITGNIISDGNAKANFGSIITPLYGNKDIYLAKYDKYGNAIWAKILGDKTEEEADAIAVDKSGNVYISGYFRDSTMLDGVPLKIKPLKLWGSNDNMMDMFIAKYDKNGKQLWAKTIAGSGYERPTGIAIDNSGKFYVTGYYAESIYFNNIKYTTNSSALFIACFDGNGNANWAKSIGKEFSVYPARITISSTDDIIISGSFSGPQDFDGIVLNPNNGAQSLFVTKLNNTGNVIWAKAFAGTADAIGYTHALDPDDNIYFAGSYRNFMTFDNITLGQGNTPNAFITKLDKNGLVKWAKSIDGNGEKAILDIAFNNKNLYAGGYLTSEAKFGDITLNGNYNLSGFTAKYSDDGVLEKAEGMKTTVAYPEKVLTDQTGNAVFFGAFNSPITYLDKVVIPLNTRDLFLYKTKL